MRTIEHTRTRMTVVEHRFEPTFYVMWVWTATALTLLALVAVEHL